MGLLLGGTPVTQVCWVHFPLKSHWPQGSESLPQPHLTSLCPAACASPRLHLPGELLLTLPSSRQGGSSSKLAPRAALEPRGTGTQEHTGVVLT